MGIIQRQAVKQSIVNYFAAGIAAISTLFIYPLELEIYGLAQLLTQTALFLFPFASLGVTSLAVRYFPEFRDEKTGNHGLLFQLFFWVSIAFVIFVVVTWLFRTPLQDALRELNFDVSVIVEYFQEILAITIVTIYLTLLVLYISNWKRIVVPAIIRNLLLKVALPILILLVYFNHLTTGAFVHAWVWVHVFALIALVLYAKWLGALDLRLDFGFISRNRFFAMAEYAAFNGLSSIGSVLSVRIDVIMVGLLVGLDETGVYSIALFIASVIEIPTKAIWQISSPLISTAWNNDDEEEIEMIYKKSSLNLLIPGLLIFLLTWASLDPLFQITPRYDELSTGVWVVLFLGLAKLVDMLTSVNTQIIAYSKWFKYNLLFLLILAMFNVVFNYVFIGIYGITGAALATFASIILFNISKSVFISIKTGMHPFSPGTWKILAVGMVVYGLSYILPDTGIPILTILLNSVILGSLYLVAIYSWKVSQDFNNLLDTYLSKVGVRR